MQEINLLLSVPNDPRRVIVQKLAVLVDGRADVEIDLTGEWHIYSAQIDLAGG